MLLAWIPPTLAAARITYWGFSREKKVLTADWLVRSSSVCERRIRLV